jgi:hypothetical protein
MSTHPRDLHTIGEVSVYDPRFEEDDDENTAALKGYIMQELRFALYFCRDYLHKYSEATTDHARRVVLRIVHKSSKPKQL